MSVTTVRSRWNGGNLEFLAADGSIILVIDGTNARITLGTSASTAPQELHVFDGGAADEAGRLVLYDHNGNARYLWVDSSGDLRVGTSAPANDTSGTVVGTQS